MKKPNFFQSTFCILYHYREKKNYFTNSDLKATKNIFKKENLYSHILDNSLFKCLKILINSICCGFNFISSNYSEWYIYVHLVETYLVYQSNFFKVHFAFYIIIMKNILF